MLILAGPTAAGKTAASLAVAKQFGAVVLSADAMQVYRGMDIGTAKATPEERATVPHFGIDVVAPTEAFDAADFAALGHDLLSQGQRVVVAGGTTMYIQALIRGLVETAPVDLSLRAEMAALDDPHSALRDVDPALAQRLHPNDLVRIIRGLEVYHSTGERLSDLQIAHQQRPDLVEATGIWFDREDLRDRIVGRLGGMIDSGYVEEVQALLNNDIPVTAKPMRSLGYKHLCEHLTDGVPLDEAIRRIERDTWRFARKQRSWMRTLGFTKVLSNHEAIALQMAKEVFAE